MFYRRTGPDSSTEPGRVEVQCQRHFPFGRHGGKRGALLAALAWRDAEAKRLHRAILSEHDYRAEEFTRRTMRIAGISLVAQRVRHTARVQCYWRVRTGRRAVVSISMRKHGYADGYRKAVRLRCRVIRAKLPRRVGLPQPTARQRVILSWGDVTQVPWKPRTIRLR